MRWREHLRLKEFGLSYERPQDFVSLQHGPPVLYVVWTALWLAYHLIWILLEAYWSCTYSSSPGKWMLLMTNLSYLALSVFTLIEFIITVYVFCLRSDIIQGDVKTLPWYMRIQWIAMNVCGHAAVQVTLIYWVMLAKSTKASTINKHGINLLYILLLVCFSAKPIKFQHVFHAMLSSLFYVIVNLIYYSASGKILYPFLNWTKPGLAVLLTFGFIFISTPLAHFLLYGLYKLRIYLNKKFLGYLKVNQNVREKEEEILEPNKYERTNHV